MSTPSLLLSGFALVLGAYLIGSIPFAIVVSRAMGLRDPRSFGSRNPGATNVLRSGNKWAAALTLLGDAAKGWFAVWSALLLSAHTGHAPALAASCAVAVFLGHLYPVFLGFKGGKGVATALGIVLALHVWLAAAVVATWLIVAYASRYSSLAAIAAAIFTPLYYLFGGKAAWPFSPSLALALTIICALLCWRHKGNIARLIQGRESRIGQGAADAPSRHPRQKRRHRN